MKIERVVLRCMQCNLKWLTWLIPATSSRKREVALLLKKRAAYTCIDCSKYAPIGTRQQFEAAAAALLAGA